MTTPAAPVPNKNQTQTSSDTSVATPVEAAAASAAPANPVQSNPTTALTAEDIMKAEGTEPTVSAEKQSEPSPGSSAHTAMMMKAQQSAEGKADPEAGKSHDAAES